MNINGRVLLLAVAIGLFVRVWSVNDRPRTRPRGSAATALAQRTALPTEPGRGVLACAADCRPAATVAATPVAAIPATSVVAPETRVDLLPASAESPSGFWTPRNCPVALPVALGPGNYRVVSDRGRLALLSVPVVIDADADRRAVDAVTDFFVASQGDERWYFVRLRSATAPAIESQTAVAAAEAAPTVVVPDAPGANRKFDFTGYAPAETPLPRVIEQSSRPLPPELPTPL